MGTTTEMSDQESDLEESPKTKVNLLPERPVKASKETGSSKYFTPLNDQEEKTKEKEGNEDERPRKRQMRLDFRDGQLGTKKPLINPISRDDKRRIALAEIAKETRLLLPGLLATRPDVTRDGYLCQKETLDAKFCPKLSSIRVRVISSDTIEAALDLLTQQSSSSYSKPPVILNMANANTPGGGWRHGALAQEEAICYRTSLITTLKPDHYPIPDDAAIYSPTVLVIRDSIKDGHDLLDFRRPQRLSVVSVISCAAVCLPSTTKDAKGNPDYLRTSDKKLMLEKMRIILRTAIRNRHRKVVLGALGCGAFGNPKQKVAQMWAAVLKEKEFCGGWWEDVVFAVLNDGRGDNFKIFEAELDGLKIG